MAYPDPEATYRPGNKFPNDWQHRQSLVELGGWLFIHGSTELFAIILAGAAGFRIGWAVVFPGEDSRLHAATKGGRTHRGGGDVAGVVVMLFVAGLLEGVGRQLITGDLVRYAVAAAMLLAWLLYFYGPRKAYRG